MSAQYTMNTAYATRQREEAFLPILAYSIQKYASTLNPARL